MFADPDADGLLDRCGSCGSRAGWHHYGIMKVRAECTACAECTDEHDHEWQAMIQWNQQQRKLHRDKETGKDAGGQTSSTTSNH